MALNEQPLVSRPEVGVIGLGEMGTAFAHDLASVGFPIIGYDVDSSKIVAPVLRAASSLDVASRSDVLLIALPGSGPFAAVMDEILPALDARHVVVDTGTTLPETDVRYAEAVTARGASFVDAPLTLREGRTFIVGGELVPTARLVLEALGRVVGVGPVGAGQRTKLVNQLLVFGNAALQAEAIEFARRVDVDMDVLVDELGWPISERLRVDVLDGPDQIPLCRKDCGYLLELAAEHGARVPIASLVAGILEEVGPGPMHTLVSYWRAGETTDDGGA